MKKTSLQSIEVYVTRGMQKRAKKNIERVWRTSNSPRKGKKGVKFQNCERIPYFSGFGPLSVAPSKLPLWVGLASFGLVWYHLGWFGTFLDWFGTEVLFWVGLAFFPS